MSTPDPVIVIPGDDPPMIANSPQLQRLRAIGEVRLFDTRPDSGAEKIERVRDATVILNSRGHIGWSENDLRRLPHLKLISLASIGTDCVDLNAANNYGVTVCNVPGRTARVVAEHAFALMFGVARRLAWLTSDMREGNWSGVMLQSLAGKTLGVLGTGNIGCAMIGLARGIGMNVIAWSFHPDHKKAEELGFEYVSWEQLLSSSDVLSVHVKLTDDSRHLLSGEEISKMKPGSILINTARGAVIHTEALVDALNAGHLFGAGIDVFEEEPLPRDHPLLQCDNVVLTPHAADQLPEGIDALNSGAVNNVVEFLKGSPMNVVT